MQHAASHALHKISIYMQWIPIIDELVLMSALFYAKIIMSNAHW